MARAEATSYLLLSNPTNALFTFQGVINRRGILQLRTCLSIIESSFGFFVLPIPRSLITTADGVNSSSSERSLVAAGVFTALPPEPKLLMPQSRISLGPSNTAKAKFSRTHVDRNHALFTAEVSHCCEELWFATTGVSRSVSQRNL